MKKSNIIIVILFIACNLFSSSLIAGQIGNKDKKNLTEKGQAQFTESLKGNGMCFTPNKGQLADMNGNHCPDVLYKGDGGGADIYLRKTGISYVYTNMGEVMHKVDEQVEELIKAGTITEAEEHEKKDELMHKECRSLGIKIHRVDMDFANCNQNINATNEDELDGYLNFYYAHCPNGVLNVKQYNKVTYKNIYNNIDIVYYGSTSLTTGSSKQTGIKYDLIVQPHADPNQIKLHWKGAESIHLNREGNGSTGLTTSLVIKTSINEFYESIPKVYQIIDGEIIYVKAKYVLTSISEGEAIITFSFSKFNSSYPLVVDPWATYYGGNDIDYSRSVATDATGNVYIVGDTRSVSAIASGGFQNVFGGWQDVFDVKFDANGSRLWATYYGGTGWEFGHSVATDKAGNVFLAGSTITTTGIATGGFKNVISGYSDAFLVKFNSAGVRLWATYYGGIGEEVGLSVTTDALENVFLTGNTSSTSGIASGGFQNTFGGSTWDAFLVKFNSAGVRLWATYYGGTSNDHGQSLAIDFWGNVFLAGRTASISSIASGGFQNTFGGGFWDAFLVKFNPAGVRLWATYYGGPNDEGSNSYGFCVATDTNGNVYVAGQTKSISGIAAGGFQNTYGGGNADAFVVKFDATGSRLWGTYYGGSIWEIGWSIATDGIGNSYLLMEAEDTALPSSLIDACSYQPVFNGGWGSSADPYGGRSEDQTIVKFSPAGNKLCATYMGGTGEDDLELGGGIAIYGNTIYITGSTNGGYPVTAGAFQTAFAGPFSGTYYAGRSDAFVASLCTNICEGKVLGLNYTANTTSVCANAPVTFTPSVANSCDTTGYKFQWTFTGGTPASSDSVNPTIIYPIMGTYDVKLVVTTICKKDSITMPAYITVKSCSCTLAGQFTKGTANCSDCGCKEWIMVTATGGTSPYSYTWPDGYVNRYKNQLCPGAYTINVKDKNGCGINVNITAP